MKKIVMLFIAFCLVFNLMAQKKIDLAELNIDQLNLYKKKATDMRNEGIILTVVGTGVVILGISLDNSESEGFNFIDELNRMGKRVVVSALGVITAGVGIPLWLIGSHKKSEAEIVLMKYDLKANNSMAIKLGFSLKF